MSRSKFTQPNPPAISPSSLRACFERLKSMGPIRKSDLARMLNCKPNNVDGVLLRFESAGLLLAEDPDGLVRVWE